MARGIMYEVSTKPEDIGNMDESDFYEELSCLHADYVADIDPKDSDSNRRCLADILTRFGAVVSQYIPEDDEDNLFPNGTFSVTGITNDFKRTWFSSNLEKLKEKVSDMGIDEFATDSYEAWKLQNLINDDNADAVYLDGSIYTLDGFVRTATPDMTYYLGTTVFMH